MMNIYLREITDYDLIFFEEWVEDIGANQYMSRWFPKDFNGKLDKSKSDYIWYTINFEGMAIGSIWLERENQDTAILGIIIGESDLLGKGIGRLAIELAIEKARMELEIRSIILNVRTNNARAIACYKSCGFHVVEKNKKYSETRNSIEFYKMKLDL